MERQYTDNGIIIDGIEYREHHTAWHRGYTSRKITSAEQLEPAQPYIGRYGSGYVILSPSWRSTTYDYITYYIK